MKKEMGIILKTLFPKKQKMIVLDRTLGKIECVPPSDIYRCASVIEYTSTKWGSVYMAQDIKVIDMPLELARGDIQLIHQALELCYFCAPFHHTIDGVFDLLVELFSCIPGPDHELRRMAYLFKLIRLLGLHPENEEHSVHRLYELVEKPVDTIAQMALDLEIKQEIVAWMYESLKSHPLRAHFKTDVFRKNEKN